MWEVTGIYRDLFISVGAGIVVLFLSWIAGKWRRSAGESANRNKEIYETNVIRYANGPDDSRTVIAIEYLFHIAELVILAGVIWIAADISSAIVWPFNVIAGTVAIILLGKALFKIVEFKRLKIEAKALSQ